MVATLRQIVKVEAGGIVSVQSEQLREGVLAEVLVTADMATNVIDQVSTWAQFIGVGARGGRSLQEIDASIRELRDEWPQ